MANDIILPIQAGMLPNGFCPVTYQDMLNGFSAVQSAVLSGSSGAPVASAFIVSTTKPANQNAAWLRLGPDFRPTQIYYFFGAWLSMHPILPGLTMWWFNALPNFSIFDGGDSNAPDPPANTSGPMWQQAVDANGTTIAAQFPVVAGTLPSTTILSVPGSGGEETHKLTGPEFSHTHALDNAGINGNASGNVLSPATNPLFVGDRNHSGAVAGGDVLTKPNAGDGTTVTPHNNMPPYVVGYLLQRTARQYYKVT